MMPTRDDFRRMTPAEVNAFFESVGWSWRVVDPAKPPNVIGKAILSFEGDDAGPLGHAHLWFCHCSDESIPRHACSPVVRRDCNCPESGTSGSCPLHDNSTVSP